MPVISCTKDGKPGFKWDKSRYCYTYKKDNEASRKRAIDKAAKQGRAIKRNQSK